MSDKAQSKIGQSTATTPTERRPHVGTESSIGSPVLDHLGIAVRSLDSARLIYEALGMTVSPTEEVEDEHVRVAMLSTGPGRIELLEATSQDSVIGLYIAKHGEGLHHIAIRVENLEQTVARLKQSGVRLVSESIQTGAEGHRYVFIHPASANGVLLELVDGGSY